MSNRATSCSEKQKSKQVSIKAGLSIKCIESIGRIMVQNTLLADQCICEVLQVWPISQYLRIERSVNRNCISGILPPDYLNANTRLGLQENRDMFCTPNNRVFYSYLVVLDHYCRVILCSILVFCQYSRGKLEPIGFQRLVKYRSNGEEYSRHTSEVYVLISMATQPSCHVS